ncbi:MAG: sulfotransferase domain-containing protein [Candidatus Nanoarchaeia archaeon]
MIKSILKQILPVSWIFHSNHCYGRIRYFLRKDKKSQDILVLSFPKCGRTWIRVLLAKYFSEKNNVSFELNITKMGGPSILFSHDQKVINRFKNKKIIFLFRDPRDTIVSFYHHCFHREETFSGSIDDFVLSPLSGTDFILHYYNSLWSKYKNYPKHLKLGFFYENLRKNTFNEMKQFLEFIGEEIDEKALLKAIEYSSFDKLKKSERDGSIKAKTILGSKKKEENAYKVRKGKVGGYREELSAKSIAHVEKKIKKILRIKYYK